ncbi:MAG: peptidylprolyl isomerase, partial [Candidatus Poribacteria bacterium]|nr:peptidylprolyl isomerase [Candidatus Poribacteria bacterium]
MEGREERKEKTLERFTCRRLDVLRFTLFALCTTHDESPLARHFPFLTRCFCSTTILIFCFLLPAGDLAAQIPADEDAPATQTNDSADPPSADNQPSSEEPADASRGLDPEETPPATETDDSAELPSAEERADVGRGLDPETATPEEGELVAKGDDLNFHNNLIQIHGNGLIKYEDVVLYADHIWADFGENIMRAAGNVHLLVGNEETFANELVYNLETKKGIIREGFTYNDPWYYRGSEIFKVEDDESYIRGGSLTTCSLKHPHFYFSASQIIVKMDKELMAKNVVLKVGGIPLFYFPVYRRDLRKEDKVAKIIVKIGQSSYQGAFLNVILPLARRHRYDGALLFEQTSRRGRGGGLEGKYRVNDVKFQEIFIPLPPDATPGDRAKLDEKAQELSDRLRGEYDVYKLRQIFLEYKINEEDIAAAREKAEDIYNQLQAEDADFAQIAENDSDHQDTRYQGGDMGFLVRGERDAEGELRLDAILEEAAFQRQAGEITPILRTEFAFHILKVERVLEVYGEREIQIRRIDIAIQPSDETRTAIKNTAAEIQAHINAAKPLAELAVAYDEAELSEVNQGEWLRLNEMDTRWQYSVKRLKKPGEVTRTVNTDRGVYIFQLIEKEPTPTFEEVARQFEAEWVTMKEEMQQARESENEGTEAGENDKEEQGD